MKSGMTFRGLTGLSSEGSSRHSDVSRKGRGGPAPAEADWKFELIGANFRSWLAEAGETQILLLLDSIAHELKNRGRLFPTEIPCFRAFGLHRLSPAAVTSRGGKEGGNNGQDGATRPFGALLSLCPAGISAEGI